MQANNVHNQNFKIPSVPTKSKISSVPPSRNNTGLYKACLEKQFLNNQSSNSIVPLQGKKNGKIKRKVMDSKTEHNKENKRHIANLAGTEVPKISVKIIKESKIVLSQETKLGFSPQKIAFHFGMPIDLRFGIPVVDLWQPEECEKIQHFLVFAQGNKTSPSYKDLLKHIEKILNKGHTLTAIELHLKRKESPCLLAMCDQNRNTCHEIFEKVKNSFVQPKNPKLTETF